LSTKEHATMSLTVNSTRFGTLEIAPEAVVEFPRGLIGLGGSRYALLATSADSPFAWLHSLDDPGLALPVTRPWSFFGDYEVVLSDADAETVGIADPKLADVWVIVRATEQLEDFTANLRAPILVTRREDGQEAHQVINEAPGLTVRAPLFATP
jgi:flagellar assembly factor FliW